MAYFTNRPNWDYCPRCGQEDLLLISSSAGIWECQNCFLQIEESNSEDDNYEEDEDYDN